MTAHEPLTDLRQLDLRFVRRGDSTVLDRRIFSWPYVIARTFALAEDLPHQRTVILQTAGGAIHGGDTLRQRLQLDAGAAAELLTQGAGAVHRAHPGETTRETIELAVADGAWLDYLPQPRILFPDAALVQRLDIDLAPSAIAFVADAFTLHDPLGAGRLFRSLQSSITVRRDGEPVFIDRADIAGMPRHFAHHSCHGSLLILAPRDPSTLEGWALELSAALQGEEGLYAAASLLPSGIGIGLRFAATELRHLRAATDLARQVVRRRLL